MSNNVDYTIKNVCERIPDEIGHFVGSLRNHRDRTIVLLMLLAGFRKSDVLKLALKDIDLGRRTLVVRKGKSGHQ
jgi:integrase